jgi:hypothetical protein
MIDPVLAVELREAGAHQVLALLEAEERHGGQAAAIEAEPELAAAVPELQRWRAQQAAAALGVELGDGGRPFAPDVLVRAGRTLRAILVSPDDADPIA